MRIEFALTLIRIKLNSSHIEPLAARPHQNDSLIGLVRIDHVMFFIACFKNRRDTALQLACQKRLDTLAYQHAQLTRSGPKFESTLF